MKLITAIAISLFILIAAVLLPVSCFFIKSNMDLDSVHTTNHSIDTGSILSIGSSVAFARDIKKEINLPQLTLKDGSKNLAEALRKYYKGLINITDRIGDIFGFVYVGDRGGADETDKMYPRPITGYIPVLMYHHFQETVPENKVSTIVTPEEFEEHLSCLRDNGYNSISFFDLYDYLHWQKELPEKPFILTIDDGYTSNYTYGLPLLKKYNTKATIFMVTSFVGKNVNEFDHFTWEQAEEMKGSGFVDIQNHSHKHAKHINMTREQVIDSVITAQDLIESKLGESRVKVFAYPGGNCTEETRSILSEKGFDFQITNTNGLISGNTDLSDIGRINVHHGLTGKDILEIIEKRMTDPYYKK